MREEEEEGGERCLGGRSGPPESAGRSPESSLCFRVYIIIQDEGREYFG